MKEIKDKQQNKNQNLPKGWKKVKLGEIIENIEVGGRPKGGTLGILEGIPSIDAEHLSQDGDFDFSSIKYVPRDYFLNAKNGKIKENDILCVKDGATIGKVSRVTKNFPYKQAMINEHVFIVRANDRKLDQTFLYYKLRTEEGHSYIINNIGGSAQGGLKKDFLDYWEILIPKDINTQKRIASILSAFDDKIELNNKINQTLEEMAQAIFKEWFTKNQKAKIKKQKLSELVEIISGYPFSSKLYTRNKKALGVITIKNVQDGNFIPVCNSFIGKESIPKNMNPECRIKNGDILLSLTGNVGRVCFVYGEEYLLNQRVAKLKPKRENDRAFCYFLFRQPTLQNQLINMAKGSAQPNLSPVETGEIVLDIPLREVLDELNEILNQIYNRLVRNALENQKLAELRDLLLPKLMSEEVIVNN